MLSGNVNVTRMHDKKQVSPKSNYLVADNKKYRNAVWASKFSQLFGGEVAPKDLVDFFSHPVSLDNSTFYRDLLNEFTSYIVHHKSKNHTAAFFHLYRSLEYISYAFPLIYASTTNNFRGTYSDLSKWFSKNNEAKSELKFFETFINKVYLNDAVLDTKVDFNIPVYQNELEYISKHLKESLIKAYPGKEYEDIADNCVSVDFKHIAGFIINLRNKYAHNLNKANTNYSASDCIDSELLFKVVNEQCMTWLSMLLLEIVTKRLSHFQSIQIT